MRNIAGSWLFGICGHKITESGGNLVGIRLFISETVGQRILGPVSSPHKLIYTTANGETAWGNCELLFSCLSFPFLSFSYINSATRVAAFSSHMDGTGDREAGMRVEIEKGHHTIWR